MLKPSICLAIRDGKVLRVTYKGTARLIEPRVYGVDAAGEELLRGWQISPPPADWRTLRLDKSTSLATTATPFEGARADPSWDNELLSKIYCERQ